MDRLRSGFHRKSRKESPSRPTIITDTTAITTPAASGRSSGKTTPEPGTPQPLQIPSVPNKKTSPFRTLRDLSRSHKRARSPAAASDGASSPVSALSVRNSPIDRFMASPHPLSAVSRTNDHDHGDGGDGDDDSQQQQQQQQQQDGRPKMPSFLSLSPHEIDIRFQEIVWLERHRMVQSMANPSPDFRWARVTGDHLRKLDRYMNIQPWQNNRVRLRVPAGKQDYINASPISLSYVAARNLTPRHGGATGGEANTPEEPSAVVGSAEASDRYIAMQGPKHKTTDHVWRMAVEQLESPGVIVMLTETHEGNLEKCYPYFPRRPDDPPLEVGRKDEFGDGFRASVRCEAIEETEAGDAIELRKLVIRVYKRSSKKEAAAAAAAAVNGSAPVEAATPPVAEPNPVDENGDIKMLSPSKTSLDDEGASAQNEDEDEDDIDYDDDGEDDADSVTVELGQSVGDTPQDGVETPQPQPNKDVTPPAAAAAAATAIVTDDYEERTVWHFLYKKWPDFGVPALGDLDSFFTLMRLSRERNAGPSNPRIVHCSAGVGRSGTFIALEHIMREMDAGVLDDWDARDKSPAAEFGHSATEGGEDDADSMEGQNGHLEDPASTTATTAATTGEEDVDTAQRMDVEDSSLDDEELQAREIARHASDDLIFRTVNQLREQRRNMVQAEAQFHFIYQVVRKLWEERHGSPAAPHHSNNAAAAAGSATTATTATTRSAVSSHPPRLPDLDGEPAAKRFEFDPFVEP